MDGCDIAQMTSTQSQNHGVDAAIPSSVSYSDTNIAHLPVEYLNEHTSPFTLADLGQPREPLASSSIPGNTSGVHADSESPPLHIGSCPSHVGVPCSPESPVQPTTRVPTSAMEPTFPSPLKSMNSSRQTLQPYQSRNASNGSSATHSSTKTTGQKRLNWAEMICYTIYESPTGRLVIQELFEGMCLKFPDVTEWATGKDWEARVKNRIKSTLSIKGNLFVKVPRPSRAGSKGSWWTLTPEAQEAFRQGCLSEAVRGSGPLNSPTSARSSVHGPGTPTTPRFNLSSNPMAQDSNGARARPSSFHDRTTQNPDLQGNWTKDFSENRTTSISSTASPYWRSNLRPHARRLAPLDLNNAAMQELFGDTCSTIMSPTTPASVFSHGTNQDFTPQSATFPFSMNDASFSVNGGSNASESFASNPAIFTTMSSTKSPMNKMVGMGTPGLDGQSSFSSNVTTHDMVPQPPITADIGQSDILGTIGNMDPFQQRNVLMMLNATSNHAPSLSGGVHGPLDFSGLPNSAPHAEPASQDPVMQNIFQEHAPSLNFASNTNQQIPNPGYMNQLPNYSLSSQNFFLGTLGAPSAVGHSTLPHHPVTEQVQGTSDSHASSAAWNPVLSLSHGG